MRLLPQILSLFESLPLIPSLPLPGRFQDVLLLCVALAARPYELLFVEQAKLTLGLAL